LGRAVGQGFAEDWQHPLRHPGFTALDLSALASAGVGTGARAAAAGRALGAGEGIGRALVRKTSAGGSLLHAPPPGTRTYKIGELEVKEPNSRNALRRQAQKAHATIVNRSEHPLAKRELARRAGKTLEHQGRVEAAVERAPAELLDTQGHKLARGRKRAGMQVAMRAVAEGKPIESRIRFHQERRNLAETRAERSDHQHQITLLREASKYVENVKVKTKRGMEYRPRIREDAPTLGKVYGQLLHVDQQREAILRDTGQMTEAGLESRKHSPGQIIEGGRYEKTPARTGRAEQVREYPGRSRTIVRQRTEHEAKNRLAELDQQYEAMVGKIAEAVNPHDNPRAVQLKRNQINARVGKGKYLGTKRQPTVSSEVRRIAEDKLMQAVERKPDSPVAKRAAAIIHEREQLREHLNTLSESRIEGKAKPSLGEVTETIPGKPRRVHLREVREQKAGGRIVGSEFQGGEAYIPGYAGEPRLPSSRPSAGSGGVVGQVRKIVSRNKPYTGESLLKGQVPENTTGLVSRQAIRAVRYLQSDRFRRQILKAGHDTRQGEHDVLVSEKIADDLGELASTHRTNGKPLSAEAQALLGKQNFTLDEISGHASAFEDFRRKLFPMHSKRGSQGRAFDISALPPEERLLAQEGGKVPGYKWVDERLLRGTNRPSMHVSNAVARGGIRLVDELNNAQKLAILYLKPAYAAPNIAGNAFLNLVQQGFAAPGNLRRAAFLSHAVGERATAALDSIMGEGVARSLASEQGKLSGAVNVAAGKWSRVVDLPFRRASFIHEARQLGYDTPEKLKALLVDKAHHQDLLEAAQRAKDSIIDYERLSDIEKNLVRRVVFFYPWVKGSTRYAGHFIAEHPTQAAVDAQLARVGKEKSGLGPVPSYLEGSFKVGGKLVNPASAGVFGTTADIVNAGRGLIEGNVTQAGRLAGFLTPAASVVASEISRTDSRGIPFGAKASGGDIAKRTLFDNLPQVALARRIKEKGTDQPRKLFPVKGWGDVATPFAIGGIAPRDYNPDTLHAEADRELRAGMSGAQRTAHDFKKFHADFQEFLHAIGLKEIPKEVQGRIALAYDRAQSRAKLGKSATSLQKFGSDVNLIRKQGWVTDAQARAATRWARTAAAGDISNALAHLTRTYFDHDGVLSRSLGYATALNTYNSDLQALVTAGRISRQKAQALRKSAMTSDLDVIRDAVRQIRAANPTIHFPDTKPLKIPH
jgi:hypothetical protein